MSHLSQPLEILSAQFQRSGQLQVQCRRLGGAIVSLASTYPESIILALFATNLGAKAFFNCCR
ncbi:MAG: hypothetical protein KME08_15415 [Aphanothece sp. CMT-3BRIN-NPC111]|nr:hypothetical protein [Aphanothece sp. CMT-3BRIN-NPC111]